jgi:hypothetical protein
VTQTWVGLSLALVSALAVNWGYTWENDAADLLPLVSARRPLAAARTLLGSRAWRIGFLLETSGWIVYVVALRLAPLALVQAVSASGIGVLALIGSRGRPRNLPRHEQLAVVVAIAGLVLLGISLVGTDPSERVPGVSGAVIWLAACLAAAALLIAVQTPMVEAARHGLAAGLLFAGGDISAKLMVEGRIWLIALVPLIVFYAAGSIQLQTAFQQGEALTAAGMATLATNALPIAAGFVLFDESLPDGAYKALQIAAFATIVLSAVLLGGRRASDEMLRE